MAVADGVRTAEPGGSVRVVPVADGGEGATAAQVTRLVAARRPVAPGGAPQ